MIESAKRLEDFEEYQSSHQNSPQIPHQFEDFEDFDPLTLNSPKRYANRIEFDSHNTEADISMNNPKESDNLQTSSLI